MIVVGIVASVALGMLSCERQKASPSGETSTSSKSRAQVEQVERRDGSPTQSWPERYQGRPLMVLLENYALDVIGQLPPDRQEKLVEITRSVWDGGTDWKATLRRAMAWDGVIDIEIRDNWDRFRAAAKDQNLPADVNVFARAFADEIARGSAP